MNITFASLSLSAPILRALSDEGYTEPTPIQQNAIPEILAGKDLLATAQTGTGKTAAFSLPILERLMSRPAGGRGIRALVLSPTRELTLQIAESFSRYGRHLPLRTGVVIGGVPMESQIRALSRVPEILIATPGRLLDLLGQSKLSLSSVEMLVLDEADRMLDMGFIRDVRRIVSFVPAARQSMLFSATISKEIAELAASILRNPARVEIARPATVNEGIDQKVLFVEQGDKLQLLRELLQRNGVKRGLVFTRTKHRANRVAQQLTKQGIATEAIHSNKSQNARQRALTAFHNGKVKVLVATDIVARGIDVDGISHVFNFELPDDSESYVHRIGRTARAGARGVAFSFCSGDEISQLLQIEKLTQSRLEPLEDHSFHSGSIAALKTRNEAPVRSQQQRPSAKRRQRGRSRSTRRTVSLPLTQKSAC